MSKRAALYLRVSTDGQTVENQRTDLVNLAAARRWDVVASYEDAGISGTKGRDKRPGLDGLLKDAKRRRFDVALFWAIDRLGRSTSAVTAAMDELEEAGVQQFYFRESMDTSTAHGRAMLEMAAVFARLERETIVARIKAGVARVQAEEADERKQAARRKADKKAIGRPRLDTATEAAIRAAYGREPRPGIIKIAKEVGVGVGSVQRIIRELVDKQPSSAN